MQNLKSLIGSEVKSTTGRAGTVVSANDDTQTVDVIWLAIKDTAAHATRAMTVERETMSAAAFAVKCVQV